MLQLWKHLHPMCPWPVNPGLENYPCPMVFMLLFLVHWPCVVILTLGARGCLISWKALLLSERYDGAVVWVWDFQSEEQDSKSGPVSSCCFLFPRNFNPNHQDLVVHRLDSAIQHINHHLLDKYCQTLLCYPVIYPMDSAIQLMLAFAEKPLPIG